MREKPRDAPGDEGMTQFGAFDALPAVLAIDVVACVIAAVVLYLIGVI